MIEQGQRHTDDLMRIEVQKRAADIQKMRVKNDKFIEVTRKSARDRR